MVKNHEPNFLSFLRSFQKGPVKLIQRVKIAHSFLHVISKLFHPRVPPHHFQFAQVALHLKVKEFFETHCRPGGEGGNGPPEGKFTKLRGKVNCGVLSSKLNVIGAKKGTITLFFYE